MPQLNNTKSLLLNSHIITVKGVIGDDITGLASEISPYSVGLITMIQQQLTGEVTVKISYQDGVSENALLEDVFDTTKYLTGVSIPNCPTQGKASEVAQQNLLHAAFCSAKRFANRHICVDTSVVFCESNRPQSHAIEQGSAMFFKIISVLVFVAFDGDADTPALSARGFDKLPVVLQKSKCVTPWLQGSQPGVGPDGTFGYWMGYNVDMLQAVKLFNAG